MKKLFTIILMALATSTLVAANIGDYIDLLNNIHYLEQSANSDPYKKDAIILSKRIISAADQTMAETIMLMMVEASRNGKPIFCVPNNFYLDADSVERLMDDGFKKSTLPIEKKREMPAVTFAISELHRKYAC